MTCVCSVGLDMIAIPGDTKATTISGIIADEMAIGMVNQKTTAVAPDPGYRKRGGRYGRIWRTVWLCADHAGEHSSPVTRLYNRGGRIPAPIHSFKN